MMRSLTSTAIACALAGIVTVFAQERPPSAPQEQQQPPPATLTGCVVQAKTTDGGTAFVLNNAEGGTAKMYLLIGQASVDVASHVNQKVEVTGQVQEPNPPPPAEEGAPAKPNVVRPPIVQVAALKMIAENCQ